VKPIPDTKEGRWYHRALPLQQWHLIIGRSADVKARRRRGSYLVGDQGMDEVDAEVVVFYAAVFEVKMLTTR